jgi:hypothetical protein
MNWMFYIGQQARHISNGLEHHDKYFGIVMAREFYENASGGGQWYYVRWSRPDGDVASDSVRFHMSELCRMP